MKERKDITKMIIRGRIQLWTIEDNHALEIEAVTFGEDEDKMGMPDHWGNRRIGSTHT